VDGDAKLAHAELAALRQHVQDVRRGNPCADICRIPAAACCGQDAFHLPEHPAISREQARLTLATTHDKSVVERLFDLLDENMDRALDATERKHAGWYAHELRRL